MITIPRSFDESAAALRMWCTFKCRWCSLMSLYREMSFVRMKVTFTIFLIWLCSHPFSCLSSLPLQHQGYEVDMEKRVCVGNMTILALVTNLYFTRLKVMSLKGKGFLFGHGHLVVKIVVVEWSLWWTWVHWCVTEYAGMVAFMKVSKSVPGVTPVKLRFIAIRCYFSWNLVHWLYNGKHSDLASIFPWCVSQPMQYVY